MYSISAATGEGVLELVRGARARLDTMPVEPLTLQVSSAGAELAAGLRDTLSMQKTNVARQVTINIAPFCRDH